MFLKFASRSNGLNSSWNCSMCLELKILGYHLRVFRSSREFLLLPLILAELCLGANTAASQAKMFRFVLQQLFGRTKFSVSYNGRGAAFVL